MKTAFESLGILERLVRKTFKDGGQETAGLIGNVLVMSRIYEFRLLSQG